MIQLSSKRRLSSFNGISLPDIDTGKRSEKQQPSAKLCAKESGINPKFYDDGTAQASSLPEYETWIEMGPEGEIVQKRLLAPLPKSQSDSALNDNNPECERESRIDSFLNRTRNIFNSDKLKKSVELLSGRSSASEESKPSWSPDSDDTNSKAGKSSGGKFRSFTNAGFKAPLKELQEKIKEKISERKISQDSDVDDNMRSSSTKISFLSDIRNRFAMSPKLRKKATATLTEEEIERRNRCKTTIMYL